MNPIQFFRPGDVALTALPPLSLYIHLPWCVRKCPYCDFNSHQGAQQDVPEQRYVDALVADLDTVLPMIWGRKLHTVFIGGGTPSLFSPEAIDRLLAQVRARLGMPVTGEVTMEANPGTFEVDRFKGYREAGVSRLSIGVQSFNDAHLHALGRIHSADQASRAIECARQVYDTINVDLMYGLPGQSPEQAVRDVQMALAFKPPHLSLYQLTLEPNTQFAVKPPVLPQDDALLDIEDAVHDTARAAGLERYEVSAWSMPGHRCQHNLNYWQFGDYIGIGAGAHAKISFPNRIVREVRVRQPGAYMEKALAGDARLEQKTVPAAQLPFEFMLNALRLVEGVPSHYFEERCGRPVVDVSAGLKTLVDKGLVQPGTERMACTETGYRFLNDVVETFLTL